jgi:hypothetical protein
VSAVRLSRLATVAALALAVVLSVVSGPAPDPSSTPALVPAADTSAFRAANIISDAVFFDSESMTAAQIQAFLNGEGANCHALSGGPACLKDYRLSTVTRPADTFCTRQYTGAANESAATIIAKVATACDINPRVLLVTLEKELSLVTATSPTAKQYTRAMGYGCPDSSGGTCDSTYNGLFNQLYSAAKQFQRYKANPSKYGYKAGLTNNVQYHPNTACGSSPVLIANQATAGLYNYTPYQPNAAALAAGYGSAKNSCSSYGNRNFWLLFTDWFGSTQTIGRDVDAPTGNFESARGGAGSLSVSGWTYDPSAPTAPIAVHVYVDGVFAGPITADRDRPDVGAAFAGVGSSHGFSGSVPAPEGVRTACVYAVNTGAGYTNPLLGCKAVTVASGASRNPIGGLEPVTADGTMVRTGGWTYDPDAMTTPVVVHYYVDGSYVSQQKADVNRPDVAAVFPQAGAAHGFTFNAILKAGKHTICAFAINIGIGTTNPELGCRTVTLEGAPPKGALQQVTAEAGVAELVGWALDPDTTKPVDVHVYVNGGFRGVVKADVDRADVGATFPASGSKHGFDTTLSLDNGTNEVCLYAINLTGGYGNPKIGCKTLTVTGVHAPIGTMDSVTVIGTTVAVSGWAMDEDLPEKSIDVHLYVDGNGAGRVVANGEREDVAAEHPGAGTAHGWAGWLSLAKGKHKICAYGINVGGGVANPTLKCVDVTIG